MDEKILSLTAAYPFGNAMGLELEVAKIRDMAIEWNSSYTSSVRRGCIIDLFEKHGVFGEFKEKCWPFGNTSQGAKKRQRYLDIKGDYEKFLEGNGPEDLEADPEEPPSFQNLQFALEAHLREFLAKNIGLLEKGLGLYKTSDQLGVEFPIDSGRIDLLGVDKNGKFVIIELKLSQGRQKTLGQLLYYMGWVDQHLGNGPCRGLIVANEITDELCLAISRVPGVSLARYKMHFDVELIQN
ncbi:MAG: endonuclease NucS domain-containing protein [Terracidiphilus sp.]